MCCRVLLYLLVWSLNFCSVPNFQEQAFSLELGFISCMESLTSSFKRGFVYANRLIQPKIYHYSSPAMSFLSRNHYNLFWLAGGQGEQPESQTAAAYPFGIPFCIHPTEWEHCPEVHFSLYYTPGIGCAEWVLDVDFTQILIEDEEGTERGSRLRNISKPSRLPRLSVHGLLLPKCLLENALAQSQAKRLRC